MLTAAAAASPERVSGLLAPTARGAKTCTAASSHAPAVAAASAAVRNGYCMLKDGRVIEEVIGPIEDPTPHERRHITRRAPRVTLTFSANSPES
jgi:hypothetical protein